MEILQFKTDFYHDQGNYDQAQKYARENIEFVLKY